MTGNGHGDDPGQKLTVCAISELSVRNENAGWLQLAITIALDSQGADAVLIVPAGRRLQEVYAPPQDAVATYMPTMSNGVGFYDVQRWNERFHRCRYGVRLLEPAASSATLLAR